MRTPDAALTYLREQERSGSTAWAGLCEKLARSAYGLPAHYSSANLHAAAIPAAFRHGHELPRTGDLVLYRNATHGHIVVATGNGWECYTNDYGGRGRVTRTDARNLVSWCGASEWFVADAWWSSTNYIHTHDEGEDGQDMPLTDEDVDRIARRVWSYTVKGQPRDMAQTVTDARTYAENAPARTWGYKGAGQSRDAYQILRDVDSHTS